MPTVPLLHSGQRGHMVICGDGPLALRLADELTTRHGQDVTVIMPSKRRRHGPKIAKLSKVHVVEASEPDEDALRAARVDGARALALVGQDEIANIHTALRAEDVNPRLRMVIRMSNTRLGHRIRTLFADCAVLSDTAMAAPSFVAAALGEVSPQHVRVAGRTLVVADRRDAATRKVLCGLAETTGRGTRPALLPPRHEDADLVLAIADGAPHDPLSGHRRHRFGMHALVDGIHAAINRALLQTLIVLAVLALGGIAVFAMVGHKSWLGAAYFTLLYFAGAGDPDSGLDATYKLTQTVIVLAGIALIPVITATVVDTVVRARLAGPTGRLRGPISGHVVVVGLGEVGSRVVVQLHDLGLPVVAVEHDEDAAGVALAHRLGVPVLLDDATQEETLRAARVDDARALVTVTSDDITNLKSALNARTLREDLRVVLRLFDDDLAQRVHVNFGIDASHSVSFLAASSFAAAMMDRQVIGTIPVGRSIMLIAEVPVAAGSELDGEPFATTHRASEARAIGLKPHEEQEFDWTPPEDHVLAPDDRLVVLSTRAGLGDILARSTAPSEND